ncbi:MerR family transcriptional regulator [Nonomuraea sp. NPDC048826]|uniref:MerR family transcriptional regulator n=1 Tax=Nonomuraea sp. NPDC048826 TaxID=3364347 RepID=UPI00371C8D5D
MADHLTIGEIAERTGLSVHTLRFYEREGLFARRVERDAGGRRLYTVGDVEWLDVCVLLRASGMPLPDIRRYAELVSQGGGTEDERLKLMRAHRERVLARLEELNRALDLITFKVGVYEDRLESRPPGRECRVSSI